VARYYFKLLAYKDEYEVARLYTDGAFIRQLTEQFEGDYRLQFHLAPSWLSKLGSNGEPRKRQFGPWMFKAFGVLAKFKFLRGTALDPFGYSAERKLELQLIAEYEQNIAALLEQLNANNYRIAVAIAELPEQIRGYGHVKQHNVDQVREQGRQLQARLPLNEIATVQLFKPAA
jgi:indolepyruvate ferredoxin oxidoreductase